MSKPVWFCLVLALSSAAPGCRMCCPSYDYCGPTNPGDSNSECCGMARRGSIFSSYYGPDAPYAEGETIVGEGEFIEEHPALDPQVQPTPVPAPSAVPSGPMTSRPRTSTAGYSSRRSS